MIRAPHYCRGVLDISFVVGLALGTIVTGFCAIGSFDRGVDSVRRKAWSGELDARKRAVVASRTATNRRSGSALRKAS